MKLLSRHWKVIWQSMLFGVLYWIVASVFDAFVLYDKQLFESLLNPAPHDFLLRFFAFCCIAAVSFFVMYKLSKEESNIAEKEHLLGNVFTSIQDGISILDTKMRIVRVNPKVEEWHAHSMPLVGKKCYEAYHNRTERCEICPSWEALQTGKSAYIEVPMRDKEGAIVRWLSIFSFPIFDVQTGALKGIVEYVRDITPRKQTEESLREINETLRTLVYASPLAIIAIDKQCNVKFWSHTAEHIFGWKENEVAGHMIPIISKGKCFEFNKIQEKSTGVNSYKGMERVCLKKDGSNIDVEAWAAPLKNHDNEVVGAIWFLADIMERKNMELELVESEKKYRNLFEDLNDVIYISTPDGRFIDINESGVRLLGYSSKEEILNLNLEQDVYAYPDDRKRLIQILNERPFVDDFETILKKKDGEHITVNLSVKPEKNHDGSMKFIRGIIRDITDKKKLEQKLLHAQKMEAIGQLAGGIAHDFNNILTAVIGYANLLKMKLREEDPAHDYVDAVLSTAERGATLTNGLLTFSRKQTVELRIVDLNSIIERTGKLLLRLIGEDVELKMILSDKNIPVMADSLQLEQILMNLATNARDAMPNGGMLTIETQQVEFDNSLIKPSYSYMQPGKYALVSFTDTGVGMDEKIKGKVFEPFFTTKEVGKGTGLGLAIVYGIVKQHKGYINVYSEPGKGTTFKLYLPLVQAKIDDTKSGNLKAQRKADRVILLGEDDKMVRKIIKSILEEFKYKVIEASNGEEVLNKFTESKDIINLLILDLIMPKKSGKEVFNEIKKMRQDIKVIFTSGYSADFISENGEINDDCSFIPKPVSPDELLKLVEKVLSGKA